MSRRRSSRALLAAAFVVGSAVAFPVFAEKADRGKPVNIESDRMTANDAKKVATFTGKVVLTQGTLTIRADRLVVHEDEQGFQSGVAYGNPATFRQKREGFNEYVYGEALRLEYDGRADKVQLFDHAHLKRDDGDDVRGNYISYDSNTEFFTVESDKAAPQSRDARVRAIIMPKKKGADAAKPAAKSAAPTELKPAPPAASPRQD